MRSNSKSKDQTSSKPAQPMMQTLESRRLMSLSGAVEYPVPSAAPHVPHLHSFGFENQVGDSVPPPAAFAAFATLGSGFQPLSPQQFGDLEAQLASAIAHGTAITISPPLGATPTPIYADNSDRSLSAMYASLETSTLASIDAAAMVSQSEVVGQQGASTPAPAVSFSSKSVPVFETEMTRSVTVTSNPIAADAVNTPLLMVTPGTVASAPQADVGMAAPHALSPSLEAQFQAIALQASEAVSQLGRDMAISLAHLEDEIIGAASPAMQQLSGWRGGALVAGAMVAAVYLQSRSKDEQSQQGSVFSKKVVQIEIPDVPGM